MERLKEKLPIHLKEIQAHELCSQLAGYNLQLDVEQLASKEVRKKPALAYSWIWKKHSLGRLKTH